MRLKTLFTLMRSPRKFIKVLGHRGFFNVLPDRFYLKIIFRAEMGRKLNLDNPETFTEKLQWLKLYNRKPEFKNYADKYLVRSYIAKTLGEEHLIPLISAYDKVEEIEWNALPNKFAIKCNHGSGTNIICNDKSKLNTKEAEKKLRHWMKKDWYWFGREWPYKGMKRKIIVEELLEPGNGSIPNDYKFWVFNGRVKFINVHYQDDLATKISIYNRNWELQNHTMVFENNTNVYHEKPTRYDEMILYAEKIAGNLPFVRVDFYEVNNQVYFGEITFFPTSGFIKFFPKNKNLDNKYGDLIKL